MATDADKELIDLIDRGSYSHAKTLIDRRLVKFPQKSLYHILQNKILLRTGEEDLAIKNNVKLMKQIPNDPMSVELLSEFFAEVGMDKEVNIVYENVIKKYPISSKDMCLHWWNNSIEKFDLKLYNLIFMYLNKHEKSRLYTFWYSFSYYLLLKQNCLSDKEVTLYRALGKKLIEGLQPFENTQELYVYTKFLLEEEDYQSIVAVIEATTFNLDLDLKIIYRDAMKHSENFKSLYEYTEDLLFNQKFNDYDTWKALIFAAKQLNKPYEEIKDVLSRQPYSRNGMLAQIELARVYDQDTNDPIKQYYEKTNHKLCCYYDLANFELSDEFFEMVKASTNEILESYPTDVNQLTRMINNQKFQFERRIDDEFSWTNWRINKIYANNKSIQGGEFDNNPLHELNLISIILDLSKNSSSKNLIKCIGIINHLLQEDAYNHKLQLWLVKLYSRLNTSNLIYPVYQNLKIKMTQHETLLHYLTTINPSKDTLDGLVNIFRFYLTAKHEIKSGIENGFQEGVFNKLESFINFGKRLQNSISLNFLVSKLLQFVVVLGDSGYLNYFIHYMKSNKKSILEDYSDNRDFTSEWKLGLKVIDQDLLKIPVQDTNVKLKLLIYLIIFEEKPAEITKLLKLFNKIISNEKSFSRFDSILYKLYFNLLKISKTNLNSQEVQSLFNFIQKNLKFDKLKTILIPEDILSGELNQNLINLSEFIKIIQMISRRNSSSFIKQLVAITETLPKDIKLLRLASLQIEQIDSMDFEIPFIIDIGKTKKTLQDSIDKTTTFILNTL